MPSALMTRVVLLMLAASSSALRAPARPALVRSHQCASVAVPNFALHASAVRAYQAQFRPAHVFQSQDADECFSPSPHWISW